jgi:hypothetical protein
MVRTTNFPKKKKYCLRLKDFFFSKAIIDDVITSQPEILSSNLIGILRFCERSQDFGIGITIPGKQATHWGGIVICDVTKLAICH